MKKGYAISLATLLSITSLFASSEGDLTYQNSNFGYESMSMTTTSGKYNTAIGVRSGYKLSTGWNNTYLGAESGQANSTGHNNTLIGTYSAWLTDGGDANTFIGAYTGYSAQGSDNVYLGASSGYDNTGDKNTFIGRQTGSKDDMTINNSILLGYQTGYYADRDNILMISNSDRNDSLIYGEFDTQMLRVNGTMEINSTKEDVSDTGDGSEYGYMALRINGNDLSRSETDWHIAIYDPQTNVDDRELLIFNKATQNAPFGITNNATDSLFTLIDHTALVNKGDLDLSTFDTLPSLLVNGEVLSTWSGSNTARDGTRYLFTMSANNSESDLTSDAGFAMENQREGFTWEFRTYEAAQGFTATKAGTGGGEFVIENTTSDYHDAKMVVAGVTVFENGHLVTSSSRELKTDIKPLDTQAAMDTLHALQPVSYEYKAYRGDKVVGFIAEDIPDLVAMPSRKAFDSAEVVAVLTKVVQEQDKELAAQAQKIKELEKVEKRVIELEALIHNTLSAK